MTKISLFIFLHSFNHYKKIFDKDKFAVIIGKLKK